MQEMKKMKEVILAINIRPYKWLIHVDPTIKFADKTVSFHNASGQACIVKFENSATFDLWSIGLPPATSIPLTFKAQERTKFTVSTKPGRISAKPKTRSGSSPATGPNRRPTPATDTIPPC